MRRRFLIFCLVAIALAYITYSFHKKKEITQTIDQQIFTNGTSLLYYNKQGIFQIEINQQPNQIFPSIVSDYPVLSPNNRYLAFCSKGSLWIYDFLKQKNQEIPLKLNNYPNYTHQPFWSNDSSNIFITNFEKTNKLYQVNLKGKVSFIKSDYQGNIFKPKLIKSNFISFTSSLSDGNEIGIIDLSKKAKTNIFTTPTNSDNSIITFLEDGHFLKINANTIKKDGPIEKETIYGLEILDINTNEVKTISVPNDIKNNPKFKRLQPFYSCGNNVVLVDIIDETYMGKINETFDKFYFFNTKNQSITELKGISKQIFATSLISNIRCNLNSNDQAFIQNSVNGRRDVSITTIDFTNPTQIKTLDYNRLLSEDVSKQLKNDCITASIQHYNGGENDFIYLELSKIPLSPKGCDQNQIDQITGLYRLSLKEQTFTKVLNENENGARLITHE